MIWFISADLIQTQTNLLRGTKNMKIYQLIELGWKKFQCDQWPNFPSMPNDVLGKYDNSTDFVVCIQLTQPFKEKPGLKCVY